MSMMHCLQSLDVLGGDGGVWGVEGCLGGEGCQPKMEWIQLLRSYIYILSYHPRLLISKRSSPPKPSPATIL